MLKTFIEINLINKYTNIFNKSIKEQLFSNDNRFNQLLNNMIKNELPNYKLDKNALVLCSYHGKKQLNFSKNCYFYNSLDYSHSFIFFNDNYNNISIQELQLIANKLKIFIEKYLNYEINNPTISLVNSL